MIVVFQIGCIYVHKETEQQRYILVYVSEWSCEEKNIAIILHRLRSKDNGLTTGEVPKLGEMKNEIKKKNCHDSLFTIGNRNHR